jgi:hypothetical protein
MYKNLIFNQLFKIKDQSMTRSLHFNLRREPQVLRLSSLILVMGHY